MIPVLVQTSGAAPDLGAKAVMRLVTTREASALTGLLTDQLREWTSRRALIPADVRPKGQGSPARYAWQTILLLRLAVILRDRFRVELQTHKTLFTSVRLNLRGSSFVALWGKSLAIYGGDRWRLLDGTEQGSSSDDAIVLRLDPHLEVLSVGFALPHPSTVPGQFEMFPAQGLSAVVTDARSLVRNTERGRIENKRRRSA